MTNRMLASANGMIEHGGASVGARTSDKMDEEGRARIIRQPVTASVLEKSRTIQGHTKISAAASWGTSRFLS